MTSTSKGYAYGVIAVLLFSPTAPSTRLLTGSLSPLLIGSGRICFAGIAAALLLTVKSERWPGTKYLMSLVLIAASTGVIFPLFLSVAMQTMPASTGIVFLAIIPLATSIWAAVRFRDKITSRGWAGYAIGAVGLVLLTINGTPLQANRAAAAMLVAVCCVSFGFAEGGALSRQIQPWAVVSWSLILALPVMLLIAFLSWNVSEVHLSIKDVVHWVYLGLVCSFLAYFPWYQSMKLIGIAHTSRLQLLQPFCGLALSLMLLHEHLTYTAMVAFSLVLGGLLLGDESRVMKRKGAVFQESVRSIAPSLYEQLQRGLSGDLLAQLHSKEMDEVLSRWCSSLFVPLREKAPGILGELFAQDRIQEMARLIFSTSKSPAEFHVGVDRERMLQLVTAVLGNPLNRLGTYGTLSPGQINHHVVEGLKGEWSAGTTYGRLQPHGWGNLYGFPVMVFDPHGDAIPIHVLESHKLPEGFKSLDSFEGSEYRRVVLPVKLTDGTLCGAQVYVRSSSDFQREPESSYPE